MAQISSSQVEPLVQRLTQLEQRLRLLLLVRGFGALAVAAVVSIGAALILDLLFDLGPVFRTGLLVLCALTSVWVGWRRLLRPFLSTLTAEELAAVVERSYPELKERLVSVVELENPDVPEQHKGSPLMRELLARQTLKQASRVPFHRAVPAAPYGRRLLLGMSLLAMMFVPSLLAPDSYTLLLSRLFLPWQNHESVGFFLFDVEPGDCVIPRGDDLVIQVTVRRRAGLGRFPDVVWLQTQAETGGIEKRR
nr:hypothetical protein [Anaerolineae bacterium]